MSLRIEECRISASATVVGIKLVRALHQLNTINSSAYEEFMSIISPGIDDATALYKLGKFVKSNGNLPYANNIYDRLFEMVASGHLSVERGVNLLAEIVTSATEFWAGESNC